MDNYRCSRFCENLNIANFETTGEFNMPVMMPYRKDIAEDYVSFNCAKSTKAKITNEIIFENVTEIEILTTHKL